MNWLRNRWHADRPPDPFRREERRMDREAIAFWAPFDKPPNPKRVSQENIQFDSRGQRLPSRPRNRVGPFD